MENIKIIMGRSGTGKTRQILETIRDSQGEHIVLVPDTVSHRTEREICRICGDGISLRGEVLTFSRLCNKVFHECGGEHEPELDKAGRMVLLEKAVSLSNDRLEILNKYTQQVGFYDKLVKTLEELKSNRVSTETLFLLDGSQLQHKKLKDIGMICGFYDSFTRNLTGTQGERLALKMGVTAQELDNQMVGFDPRDRMSRLAEVLADSSWGEGKIFWVDGFADFTPQQLGVLEELWKQGESMTFALMGDLPERGDLDSIFAPTFQTVAQLENMVKSHGKALEFQECVGDFPLRKPVLQHLEAELFQQKPAVFTGELAEEIRLYAGNTITSEVEWLGGEIRELVRSGGYRYRDFLVVARNFSTYQKEIQRVFPRLEIPVFASSVQNILEKPVVSVVNLVFQVLNGHFATVDVLRYLKTGFSSLEESMVDQLENYVLMWDIQEWKKPWTKHSKRFDGDISLEKLEEMKAENHPEYERKLKEYNSNQRTLEILNGARKRVIAPFLTLEKSVKKATGKEQCKGLYQFLQDIKLQEQIEERQEDLQAEGNMALHSEYAQLWEIICVALEQSYQLLEEKEMAFSEFSKIITLVLAQYSVSTIPTYLDQVTAGESTRMKNHRSKVVFFLGCEENALPMVSSSGGLLTDKDRALLRELEISLNQDTESLLYREMTSIYEICALATDKIYFSYPTVGQSGESLGPCFLFPRLQEMYPSLTLITEEMTEGRFRLVAPVPALEQSREYPFVLDLLACEYPKEVAQIGFGTRWSRGHLSETGVEALYGSGVSLSATALRSLYSCHYGYFLYYGLGARKREVMTFNNAAYGNMVHYALEVLLRDFIGVTEEEQKKELLQNALGKVDAILDDYRKNQLGGQLSKREYFLFLRMGGYVKEVVTDVLEEMSRSAFVYQGGESKFSLPLSYFTGKIEEGLEVTLTGSIDRVDTLEEGDTTYIHTVDYKTGSKKMDYAEFYTGRDLQLFLYYLALGSGQIMDFSEKELEMAALSYLPGKTILGKGASDISVSRRKEVRHVGVFTDDIDILTKIEAPVKDKFRYVSAKKRKKDKKTDPVTWQSFAGSDFLSEELFQDFLSHTKTLLGEAKCQIESGKILANPYVSGEERCKYCPFLNFCHFEEGKDQGRIDQKINLAELREKWREEKDGSKSTTESSD
ncbi:MAG: PD-(D/E)XK nuclease family protein [Eubacteriales bacterium]